jgi:hypothetical protein
MSGPLLVTTAPKGAIECAYWGPSDQSRRPMLARASPLAHGRVPSTATHRLTPNRPPVTARDHF